MISYRTIRTRLTICYDVIVKLADDGRIYDVMPHYAKNIITCFIRLDGATVGVIANQPEFRSRMPGYRRFRQGGQIHQTM